MCEGYEMIYEMPTWDTGRVSVWVLESQLAARRDSGVSGWGPRWSSVPLRSSQRASGWVPLGLEAEKVLRVTLKITQRGMIKRRNGSMWQTPFVSLCPSVSLLCTPAKTLTENKKMSYVFYNKVLLSYFLPSLWLHNICTKGYSWYYLDGKI